MDSNLKSKIDHCYRLADNGATEFAQAGFKVCIQEFCDGPLLKSKFKNPEAVLKSIERASYRIGVDVALKYAEHFYQKGDKKAARGWLSKAKWDAKQVGLDVSDNISGMKSKYKDRMPIPF